MKIASQSACSGSRDGNWHKGVHVVKADIKPKGALQMTPCRYGLSRQLFRGPMRPTDGRFAAFLGGCHTFGRFIDHPYPDLIETAIGEVCVNLGCPAAGPDVFLQDPAVQALCHDAAITVVQVPGAVNLSNLFYRVHPRRNDRFIAPSATLIALYPEVDFTEFAFTGHLIARLQAVCPARFSHVRAHLQAVWIERMGQLIRRIDGLTVLLWFAARAPEEATDTLQDPALVNRRMLETLRPAVADIVEVVCPTGDVAGMRFAPLDAGSARASLGVQAHMAAAKALRAPVMHGLG